MALVEIWANNAITTVAVGGLSASATTLNLAAGTGVLFPSPIVGSQFFRISLTDQSTRSGHEIVYCTSRSGDVCTVVRGQEGTTASAWLYNDIVANQVTAGAMLNTVQIAAIQNNTYISAIDTGTANNYKIALTPSMPTSVEFATIEFQTLNTNTGASTIQINGGTTYNLYGLGGVALQGGEIIAGGIVTAIFDGTRYNIDFCTGGATSQITDATQSHQASSYGQLTTAITGVNTTITGVKTAIQQNAYIYGSDTGTANTYKPVISPAPTITNGSEIIWTAGNTNTSASTVQINGTGTVYNLYGFGGIALQGGEIIAGGDCKAIYDGTRFVLEYCTGGASLQITNASKSQQATSLSQVNALLATVVPPTITACTSIYLTTNFGGM